MQSALAEHLPDATAMTDMMITAPSPAKMVVVILLAWAVGTTLLVGGLGAWVAMWRRSRIR